MQTSPLIVDHSIAQLQLLQSCLAQELEQTAAAPAPLLIPNLQNETLPTLKVLLPKLQEMRRVVHGPRLPATCPGCED